MEKWTHRSLEWIHKVRELNYEAVPAENAGEVAEHTLKSVEGLLKTLDVKLVRPVSSAK